MSSDPTQDHQPNPSGKRPSDNSPDGLKPTKPESNSDLPHDMVDRARKMLDAIPATIGPYHVIERLGAGGMGEVYRANQKTPIRRQVAVKLIKLGMDTRQVVARFEAERQALAMMDHPNIAKIFDGGTTADGRPYFVMEYVKGVPFTEYCDAAKLPLRERLKLFVPVCQAVQHAHQKGIVHRDLKPSNILICLYDGLPVPKVIDFGLAKALYQPLTDQSIYTTHGVMVGTPLYMSPEQAEQNNLDIDTRTDIYSLGVILYELLTGSTPLEREQLRAAAQHEVLRMIKEVEPPKPSTRLSGSASLPSVAAQRGIEPKQLSRSVSGDLDWIVMKALEKERSRRYATANGFAQDVERYLNDEAVEASPPSTRYKLKRIFRKHRGPIFAVGLIALSLLCGTVISAYFAIQANNAAIQAALAKGEAIDKANEADARAEGERKEKELARQNLYATHMLLAQSAWERADMVVLRELLDRYAKPPANDKDLRSFEWHYLNGLAYTDQRSLGQQVPNTDLKYYRKNVVFSQDGRLVATANAVQGVRVWEVGTGREVISVGEGKWGAAGVAFCAGSNQIAALGHVGDLHVWDVNTGSEIQRIKDDDFNRDLIGRQIEICGAGNRMVTLRSLPGKSQVIAWDLETGVEIMSIVAEDVLNESITSITLSPDGQKVAMLKWHAPQKSLEIWDVNTKERVLTITGVECNRDEIFAFSPNGERIAAAGSRGSVNIWDAENGTILGTFRDNHGDISVVTFSPDGRRLATKSEDKMIRVWDIESGVQQLVTRGHDETIGGLAFSPDGWRLVSVSEDGIVKVWDSVESKEMYELSGHTRELTSVAFSPNGRLLATSSDDATVRLWDVATDKLVMTLSNHPVFRAKVAFSLDGRKLAAAGSEGFVKIWDPISGRELASLKGHSDDVRGVAFSPNGKLLATGGYDKTVRVWDVHSQQQIWCFAGHESNVTAVAFSPDGHRLASASWDGTVRIWDVNLGQEAMILKGNGDESYDVVYSPNGEYIAACGSDRTIRFWDAVSGEEIRVLRGHSNRVDSVAFSSDGRRIVSASSDKTVKLWDTASGAELLTLSGHRGDDLNFGESSIVAISPDDSRIAFASGDDLRRKVSIWHAYAHSPENKPHGEARGLVQFLFGKGIERSQVIDQLQKDLTVSGSVRHEALQLAEHWQPDVDVDKLQKEALSTVRVPDAAPALYAKAFKQIESIYALEPWNDNVVITLGVAQYRLGRYEDAMRSFLRYDELAGPTPLNIAFLAMSQYHLGKVDLAKATLARISYLKKARGRKDEAMSIWKEAKTLLGEKDNEDDEDAIRTEEK